MTVTVASLDQPTITGTYPRALNAYRAEVPSALDFIPSTYHAAISAKTQTNAMDSYIQAALDACEVPIHCPTGLYPIANTLNFNQQNRCLKGDGGGYPSLSGVSVIQARAATRFKWIGSAGGTMVSFSSPSTGQTLSGGGLEGIMFDGNSFSAAIGISIISWVGGQFRDVSSYANSADQWLLGVSTGTLTAGTGDCQRNLFTRCYASSFGGAGAFLTSAANGWRLTGGTATLAGNTSLNEFIECTGHMSKGTSWILENCDDNFFYKITGLAAFGPSMVPLTITGISKANPAVVTYSGTDTDTAFASGVKVFIYNVVGMTQVNGHYYTIANLDKTGKTFELQGIDSSAYGVWSSGGKVEARIPGIVFGSADQDTGTRTTVARYNFFYGTLPVILARAGQSGGASSFSNISFGMSRANNQPSPLIETGAGGSSDATFFYSDSDGGLKAKNLNLKGLPTASTNLVSGDVWSNSGVLNVVA